MGYDPKRCWADKDITGIPCPLAVLRPEGGCPGGYECDHRGNETNQCANWVATPVGLCAKCHERIVPVVEKGNRCPV